ncbi:purine-cytosine permease family protein [Burkholderia sp. IMCC1007]|uniref:purine-cytosine permease family protein n=1 Tax=Burkholderia sp. IMCC1007 TaxID=3004104 RepID=UPI0022B3A5DF|nr:allantoin permease [Burkholderia sp. IMCC1007]
MAGMNGKSDSAESFGFSMLPVSDGEKMPKLNLTMAWWAVCSAVFYIVVAAILATQFGTASTVIGMLASVVTFALVNSVIVAYATRTGLSVSQFSFRVFGRSGAALATLIFFATAIYYAVFEGSVIAVSLNSMFGTISYPVACAIVVLYSVPLVFGSIQHWLDKLNGILLPVYGLGLIAAVGLAVYQNGYTDAWLHVQPAANAGAGGWWHCYIAYMGLWILMMFTFDYARFGKKKEVSFLQHFTFGSPFYLVAYVVNGLVGIFLVNTVQMIGGVTEVSVVLALLKTMGIPGLIFLWATQTRINTANYFLASINMASFFNLSLGLKAPKWLWACVVGLIVYLLMLSSLFSYILKALAYQGVFVVAWVAIAVTYIMTEGATTADGLAETASSPGAHGIVAWSVGAAAGLILMQVADQTVASFSSPATAVVSSVAYYMLRRIPQSKTEIAS